jgi:serine/threonine protein kinase
VLSWAELAPDVSDGVKPINTGQFGVVFRATRGRKAVAVKLLKRGHFTDRDVADLKAELFKEAHVLSSASAEAAENDNVVKFLGIVEGEAPPAWLAALGPFAANVLYAPPPPIGEAPSATPSLMLGMVTRWQPGGDLHRRLHDDSLRAAALMPLERLRLVAEVSAGLYGLHKLGIVHADLKPANVLLGDGPHPTAVLADFGLAKVTQAGLAFSMRSKGSKETSGKEKAAGTWPYQAPEMFRRKPVNPEAAKPSRSTDVYAMGVIAWEVLTNKRPEGDSSEAEHINELYNGEPTLDMSLPELASQPEAVRRIIRRCTAFEREERPHMGEVDLVLQQAFEEATSDTFDVFLSYDGGVGDARRPFALELHKALREAGQRVWIDNLPDGGGQMGLKINSGMRKGVAASSVAVILISPDYARSKQRRDELDAIVGCGMPFVVCLVEPGFWKDWRDADGAPSLPFDSTVALKCGLATQLYVDFGDISVLPWKQIQHGELGEHVKAARDRLYRDKNSLPLLLKLLAQARELADLQAAKRAGKRPATALSRAESVRRTGGAAR